MIEDAWYRPQVPWWLVPLSPLASAFTHLAEKRRKKLQLHQATLPKPVIVVGNIAVGGTGKTPFIQWLVTALQSHGIQPGIISRGYGGKPPVTPFEVVADGDVRETGDEPLLLKQKTKAPVFIDPDRVAAAKALLAKYPVDFLISDDGLQHYALPRDMEIVMVDGQRLLGNGRVFPLGPLREPKERLHTVDWIIEKTVTPNHEPGRPLTSKVSSHGQLFVQLQPPRFVGSDEVVPKGSAVHGVAGIGNPNSFFTGLRALGYQVIEHPFGDHHQFRPTDFHRQDNLPWVMTEKDWVKCRHLDLDQVAVAPLAPQVNEAAAHKILTDIESLVAQKPKFNSTAESSL